MKRTAYENWLCEKARAMDFDFKEALAAVLYYETMEGNKLAFDILEETGDKTYDLNTFDKAVETIINKT
jgi:hypothetical protein